MPENKPTREEIDIIVREVVTNSLTDYSADILDVWAPCFLIVERINNYEKLLYAARAMYDDLIALGQAVPEEAARIFGGKEI